MIRDQELIELNNKGFIPGPKESEEQFVQRILCYETHPNECTSFKKFEKLFLMSPTWINIEYSNKQLLPWEGGCTLIEGNKIILRIKKSFQNRKKIFGLYTKEEILAHEYVHIVRMAFDEPLFEEFLAYQSSSSGFRRYMGPLFRSSKESLFFLFSILVFVNLLYISPLFILGIAAIGAFFLLRHFRKSRLFFRTFLQLERLFSSKEKARSCMLRFTDAEIKIFARLSSEAIYQYIKENKERSLRLRQLSLVFSSF